MHRTTVGENLLRLMRSDPAVDGNENELARLTGVHQPTIHRILTGESRNPKRPTLERLGAYFGIGPDDFYTESPVLNVIHQPMLPAPDDDITRLVKAYKSASKEGQRLAVLMLEADIETGGEPTKRIGPLKASLKKRNHAKT